jgi:uncharacterized protein YfaS (alpha-2-macroglobulin family)
MNNKLMGFFKNKPALIVTITAVVLIAAVAIAALLGAFGGKDAREVPTVDDIEKITAQNTLSFANTDVAITPSDSDILGVGLTSAFKLLFTEAPDEKALAASLSVEPEQEFNLKKVSGKEYSLEFNNPLQSDSIYNLILSDNNTGEKKSWAFQTKKSFNVIRTLPRDQSVQVPVNSGIEITFSHENAEKIEEYFEISPAVKGRFEWHNKTVVFVPDKLEENTIYTVTLKKGIAVKGSEDTLAEDYSFKFQTVIPDTGNANKYFDFSDSLFSLSPQATPAIKVYTQDEMIDSEIPVVLYSYPDSDTFLQQLKKMTPDSHQWYLSDRNENGYDVSKLQKAASYTGRIANIVDNYWNNNYLVLPATVPEGYYLLEADIDGNKYYTQLQVNPLSVYIMKTSKETLAWLNDSVTGSPVSEAEFELDGGKSVKSDKDGMALLDVPNDTSYAFFRVKPVSGSEFIARTGYSYMPYYSYYSSATTDNYWSYIYLDKDMFLPEDTVNVWGVIKPRDGSSSQKEAVLELIRYNYYYSGDWETSVLTSQNVKISPDGTYTGSLKLSNYNPGSYEVRLRIGDDIMQTRYLQVMEYTKPVYKIEIDRDRDFMYAWESVNFDILTSFYEGTPVSGVDLNYNYSVSWGTNENGILKSNDAGASSISIQPSTSEEGWRPITLSLDVSNSEAEEREIRQGSYVTVFPKDTMITTESKIENQTATIDFQTNRIDLTKLEGKNSGYYSYDDYTGASVDIPVTVKLYERYYESRITGNYYDYINKVTQNTYDYYEVNNQINEYSFNTANGKYQIQFNTEKDKNYYAEIYTADSQNRPIKETTYIYNWDYIYPYNSSTYTLTSKNTDNSMELGESASVEVKYSGEQPLDKEKGSYLFIRLQNGVLDYRTSADPAYSFSYDEKLVPNMYLKAICFDGSDIYDAGIQEYWYDSSAKKLDISVKTDKDSYKPADTVKLSLEVKDSTNKPVGAELNISVVDEAFFAMAQQSVDLLSSIYGPRISSGILTEYFSYVPAGATNGSPMAEMGEGGDGYVRTDFKDSAMFTTVKTDQSGKAEVSFKLPDNLTSWRVTYQAISSDLHAGSGRINISSKIPFFVDTIFNKYFITGDNPSILLRSYGTQLAKGANVDYKVTLTKDDGTSKSFSVSGAANTPVQVQLGSLSAGNYTIKTEATDGKLKDAVERSFRVSDSLLETSVTDHISLSEDAVISSNTKGLTSVVFYGEDSSLLYNELHSLYWTWGQRLDQKLARRLSGKLLQNYFNEELYFDEEYDIKQHQIDDGGLALLTYDSSNPALSAKMASLAADDIDKNALAKYFEDLLENEETTAEDAAYCFWGLAALKEPVLLDIRSILEADDLTPYIRLVLGTALAEIGDYEGAKEIYTEAVKSSGTITDTLAWLETGTRDESIDSTALCSLIALKTNQPEKVKFFNYIKSNSTSELLVNLERMIFVSNYIKGASLSNSFSYELDGVRKQVELQKGGSFRLDLTPEKLASLKFSNIQGKVQATVSYVAPVSKIRKTEGNVISIERSYSLNGGSASSISRSDTVKVTITPSFGATAPDGYYEITDILPAGLRFDRPEYTYGNGAWWWPDEVSGQKVVFGLYYNKEDYKDTSITYYARAVSEGAYTADNAAIRHTDKDIYDFTQREQITIGK